MHLPYLWAAESVVIVGLGFGAAICSGWLGCRAGLPATKPQMTVRRSCSVEIWRREFSTVDSQASASRSGSCFAARREERRLAAVGPAVS